MPRRARSFVLPKLTVAAEQDMDTKEKEMQVGEHFSRNGSLKSVRGVDSK